ncbi:MAG: hypothetical protein AAF637_12605 [Pseudomonadota bacterium]
MLLPRLVVSIVSLLTLTGCVYTTSFRGPGYDAERGVTMGDKDQVVVALTKAVLREDGVGRSDFWTNVFVVSDSLAGRPGFVGSSLRTEVFGKNAWTMTVWTDEASLDDFVYGEVHQTAIREGFGALQAVRFARLAVGRDAIPISWSRALEILENEGRSYGG